MSWTQIRSRRDPAVWLPILVVVLVCGALALWAQLEISALLRELEASGRSDPERAVAEATRLIRLCELALGVSSLALSAFLVAFFRRALREERLPPSGWWSLGAWRMLTGPEVRQRSRVGLALALAIPLLTAATIAIIEVLLRMALAGSA